MAGLLSNLLRFTGRTLQSAISSHQSPAFPVRPSQNQLIAPAITNAWSLISVRTIIRENFPSASEYKRLKKHGWRVKLKTKNGRRQIMRRILKGRFYLTH